jgi:hypothetical protein
VILAAVVGDRITPTPACPKSRQAYAVCESDRPSRRLPELQTYDCKECGVAMTEADDSQLASTAASHRAPIIGALLKHGLLVSTPESQPVPNTDQRGTASSRALETALDRFRTVAASLALAMGNSLND